MKYSIHILRRLYTLLLHLYPPRYRADYSRELETVFNLAVDAVPRNVDPEAADLNNLFLHPVDSLQGLIQQNLEQRRREVGHVQEILDEEVARFGQWYRSLDAEPIVAALQKRAERIRQRELQNALARFPEETHEDLERLTRSLVRKILHHPSTTLRSRGADSDLAELDMARRLVHLGDDSDEND